MRGRHDRIGKLPDFADRIFKSAVTVDHSLYRFAGLFQDHALHCRHKFFAGLRLRKKLHLVLCGLVGAQNAIFGIKTASVDRAGHDIVKRINGLCTCINEFALRAFARMDIAA